MADSSQDRCHIQSGIIHIGLNFVVVFVLQRWHKTRDRYNKEDEKQRECINFCICMCRSALEDWEVEWWQPLILLFLVHHALSADNNVRLLNDTDEEGV